MNDNNDLKNVHIPACCLNFTIPLAFDQSMSYLEMLCALKDNLNKNITQTNENTKMINALDYYIKNYFIDDKIKSELEEIMQKYFENGDLEELINDLFVNSVLKSDPQFGHKIFSRRLWRQIYDTGEHINNASGEYYSHVNGMCIINDSLMAITQISSSNYNNNNSKISIINYKTGETIKSLIYSMGHANSICYNPYDNCLYVGGCSTYTNGTSALTPNNRIFKINFNSFDVIEYQCERNIGSLAYDKTSKKFYAKTANTQIIQLDESFNVQNTITLKLNTTFATGQSIDVQDDIIYTINSQPEHISLFDLNGNFIQDYFLNEWVDNLYFTGEAEDVSIYNGNVYFITSNLESPNGTFLWLNLNYTNFQHNIVPRKPIGSFYSNQSIPLYVNNNVKTINPNGTKENPFNEIGEALDYSKSPALRNKKCTITIIKSETPYKYAYVDSSNVVEIKSEETEEVNYPLILGLRLLGQNCQLSKLKFQSTNTINKEALSISDSHIALNNIITNNQQNNIGIYLNNTIASSNMTAHFFNGNLINLDNDVTLESGSSKLTNLNVLNKSNNCMLYLFTDQHLQTTDDSYTTSINLENMVDKFRFINYKVNAITGSQILKFVYNTNTETQTDGIRIVNIPDSATATGGEVDEINIRINKKTNTFFVMNSGAINIKDGSRGTLNSKFYIVDCWLSNN